MFFFCALPAYLHAGDPTTGTIHGGIYDSSNGEGLIGAFVRIEGTDLTAFADLNGHYEFTGIPAGTYTLEAGMDGFAEMKVAGVKVDAGGEKLIDFRLGSASFEAEMVVTAELLENTDAGLLKHRQRAVVISDAISSEEITRSGGGNAADAVTKITGASVVGGKYVYIRGLGERYTSTHLNGVELPTADPDVKAFQADLFPTGVLDNIVTLKSFTPDKPGNFSGGIIDIGTKSYPNDFNYEVSLSGSYNTLSTGNEDYLTYEGGGRDWLGMDDGTRGLPSLLAGGQTHVPSLVDARRDANAAATLDSISHAFLPVMSSTRESAPYDKGASFSMGDRFQFGDHQIGFLAALNYSRKFSYEPNRQSARWKLTEGTTVADSLINQTNFIGEEARDKVNWGGLASLTWLTDENNHIAFNIIYTQGGESKSHYYAGEWPEQFADGDTVLESRLLKYTERNLQSYQLGGEHYLSGWRGLRIEWKASVSTNSQDEPDTRIFTDHFTERVSNGVPVTVYSIARSNYNNPARYFRGLEEDGENLNLDFSLPLTVWGGRQAKLKFGGAYNAKDRSFSELRFEYSAENNIRYQGDPEAFFAPDNVGLLGYDEASNRFLFGNVIQLAPDPRGGNYSGKSETDAVYAMVDLPVSEKLKFIAGLRYEMATLDVTNGNVTGFLDDNDMLPSLNFIYGLDQMSNLRWSYGRTLARPTFREKAPYASYDFIADGIFQGNPDLKRTLIDNYDLRWERFPRAGEVWAASVFYKEFENPIERAYNVRYSSEFGEKSYFNVPEATVYGLELEVRKRFDQWVIEGNSNHIFSVSANFSLIESEVDLSEEEYEFIRQRNPDASRTRQLQGQSPYLVNLGLNYDNHESGTFASIYYNVFGERLDEVGVGGAPDALEQPRPLLDFTLSQRLKESLKLKFSVSNILDSPVEITQDFKGVSYIRNYYETGTGYSVSLSYKP